MSVRVETKIFVFTVPRKSFSTFSRRITCENIQKLRVWRSYKRKNLWNKETIFVKISDTRDFGRFFATIFFRENCRENICVRESVAKICVQRESVTRFFASGFFHESPSLKPMKITLGSFRIFSKIRGDIRKSRCTTGVMPPMANKENNIRLQTS
jgi:hypothetical protein